MSDAEDDAAAREWHISLRMTEAEARAVLSGEVPESVKATLDRLVNYELYDQANVYKSVAETTTQKRKRRR